MPTIVTETNLPTQGNRSANRKADILQRRVAIRLARNLPDLQGKKRFWLRLWVPLGRPRVYRLRGYATLAKVNRKLRAGRTQRFLWRLLILAIVLIVGAYLLLRFNPFENLTEIYRMFGLGS